MKHFIKPIIGGFLLLLFSCSKSADNNIIGPSLNSPLTIQDGLSFPLSKNSYWEYQRIDSFTLNYTSLNGISLYVKADTSKELITLTGDTLISSIDPVKRLLVLQVKNLTYNTVDTTFLYYTSDRFSSYTHPVTENDNFFYSPIPPGSPNLMISYSNWSKQITLPLPVKNVYRDTSSRILTPSIDTTYSTKDTTITVSAIAYNNCVYAEYTKIVASFAASGVGGFSHKYYSFTKPGIGIVFEYYTPDISQGSAFDHFHGTRWTVRRLVNYKIQ